MPRRKRKRPHHTGSIRVRDGRAQVQWSEGGRRRTKTVDLADAQAFLARANAGLEILQDAVQASGKMADLAQTWLDGRRHMASNYDERNRWKNHLGPALGHLTPDQVTVPVLKRLIIDLREKGLSKGTVGLQIALVSSFFGDLVEDGVAAFNPAKMLSAKTRQNELRSDYDWKKTPFVQDSADISRIYQRLRAMHEGVATAYAIGAQAGLRTGEVRALCWEHVDFERRLIHVQQQIDRRSGQVKDLLKGGESRFVPLTDSLYDLLWKLPSRVGRVCGHLDEHTIGGWIRVTLSVLELPKMRWYEATRHTFASQWVLNGGSLETLREMMGHSSVTVTERYAHLIPGNYSDADRARVVVEQPAITASFVN